MPRRKDSSTWKVLPTRTPTSAAPTPSTVVPKDTNLEAALADLSELDLLNTVTAEEEGENDGALTTSALKRASLNQQKLYRVGRLIGQKGTPNQVMRDAQISRQINQAATSAIKRIRPSSNLWSGDASKKFTRLLLSQLDRRCVGPEDDDDDVGGGRPAAIMDDIYCNTFVDEYLGDCMAGCVGYLSPLLATAQGDGGKPPAPLRATRTPTQRGSIKFPTPVPLRGAPSLIQSRFLSGPPRLQPGSFAPLTGTLGRTLNATQAPALDSTAGDADDLYQRIEAANRLNGKLPICMLRILIDQKSFQKSVRNFFVFSHLLHDRLVEMTIDPSGLPLCAPIKSSFGKRASSPGMFDDEDDDLDGGGPDGGPDGEGQAPTGKTIMLSLNEGEWRRLVQLMQKTTRGGGGPSGPIQGSGPSGSIQGGGPSGPIQGGGPSGSIQKSQEV
ncbi:hypothetical protein BV898_11476 [Hypsibius exemplaris]|uniref:Non-structural maintenance of chromosome element 4 C-terminal domain-containing protein n=1 Tax=Hypsibius exemplaris TaxID=2072580 RepID=A0A1W0WGN0_HYPEX|nr:hypothetical protein BV898_11476 [Hypsibius exemplaris]